MKSKIHECKNELSKFFSEAGYEIEWLEGNFFHWNNFLKELDDIPVFYTEGNLKYQASYYQTIYSNWYDLSMMVQKNGAYVAAWPISISEFNNKHKLDSFGSPLMCPKIHKKYSRKKFLKLFIDSVEKINATIKAKNQEYGDYHDDQIPISEWHLELMLRGSYLSIKHGLYVNLNLTIDEIKSNFRRSYKALVNFGLKNWNIEILDKFNDIVWSEFRELHLQVAGRVTRSIETWNIQHELIGSDSAFLVYLRNSSGSMIGGGLFVHSRDEAVYYVGAYDRNLFQHPLAHVVQFIAINEMKKRAIKRYFIGYRDYLQDSPTPSEKELSISYFKEGFATHCLPHYIFKMVNG